jgi:hypothetical protein
MLYFEYEYAIDDTIEMINTENAKMAEEQNASNDNTGKSTYTKQFNSMKRRFNTNSKMPKIK